MKNPMKLCLMASLILPLFVNNDPIYDFTILKNPMERIVKQDELDGDFKFTMTIGFGGKLSRS
jgi:hypothetical protein